MNGRGPSRDRWVLIALVVGLGLRLARLGTAPLWFDEVVTANWVGRPWPELLGLCLADNHPPLYFALVKVVGDLFGDAPWVLRLPSALLSAGIIPLVAAIAETLADRRAARWAAWFAALSPFLVHHGQEARMYALVGLLAAGNLLGLARWARGDTARLGTLFALTSIGLVMTHYYAVFYLGGAVLAAVAARPRPVRGWFSAAAVSAAGCLGAFAMAALVASHRAGGTYEFGWFALPGAVWSLVAGYALLPDTFALHAHGGRAALPYLPVALAAAPALAACGLLGLDRVGRTGGLVLVVPLAAALLGPFAVRLVLGVGVNPRYFQATIPAVLVLLAAGASWRGAWPRAGRTAAVAVGLLFATGTGLHLAEPAHGREDVRAARGWLDANVVPDQPLLVTSPEMAYLARFHWSPRPIVDHPSPRTVVDAASAEEIVQHLPWRDGRAVYVFGRAWVSDPEGALERDVRRQFASCGTFETRGVRIYCLEQFASTKARGGAGG